MSHKIDKEKTIARGFLGRCPSCGEGSLFESWLSFDKSCEACGLDFSVEDAGDGPAVFVIFAAGFTVVPLAVVFMLATNAPAWLTLLIWTPILVLACMAMLRPFRGIMLAQQLAYKAKEAELDTQDDKEN